MSPTSTWTWPWQKCQGLWKGKPFAAHLLQRGPGTGNGCGGQTDISGAEVVLGCLFRRDEPQHPSCASTTILQRPEVLSSTMRRGRHSVKAREDHGFMGVPRQHLLGSLRCLLAIFSFKSPREQCLGPASVSTQLSEELKQERAVLEPPGLVHPACCLNVRAGTEQHLACIRARGGLGRQTWLLQQPLLLGPRLPHQKSQSGARRPLQSQS